MIASGRVLTVAMTLLALIALLTTLGIGVLVRFVARLITS